MSFDHLMFFYLQVYNFMIYPNSIFFIWFEKQNEKEENSKIEFGQTKSGGKRGKLISWSL